MDRNASLENIFEKPKFLPEDEAVVEEDGEVVVYTGEDALEKALDPEFDSNLAEFLDEEFLSNLANDLVAKYEEDREAREPRDKQQREALRRAGLDDEAVPQSADFEGASFVVHPMLSKASVDFAASAVKELCPPGGPVKSQIIGEATSKKTEESQRKVDVLNYVMIDQMPYRNVFQQMLSQLPLGGSQFIKFWHDVSLKRPNCEFLPIDNVFIPFSCNDFYTAERVAVKSNLSPVEYWRRVKAGLYYDPEYVEEGENLDEEEKLFPSTFGNQVNKFEYKTRSEMTNDKIEGKTEGATDDSFTILEIFVFLNLEEDDETDGEYAPYIATIRLEDEQLIGLYRNWDIADKQKRKLEYIAKFDFIPWRGAYALGLGQLIGSLSAAGTGALRALLDAAHVNNLPTAMALKGIKMAGQSPDVGVGKISFFEGPTGIEDDIRKCFMPLPFNPPSPVLFQLLEFVTAQADMVVKTPDGIVSAMGDRTPANTTLAMIEQASTTRSAVHANLHFAQKKAFEIVSRLIRDHFDPDGYPEFLIEDYKFNGGLFQHTRDIVPVSDPNIFTEVQRYAQLEATMNLAQSNPQMFNMAEIYKRMLQLIKIPQPDLLLNLPGTTCKTNAVAENASMMMGNAIQTYPDQNHLDHLFVHMAFLKDPLYGQNPAFNQNNVAMIDHIKSHLMYFYAQMYQQAVKNETSVNGYNIMSEDEGMFDAQLRHLTPDVLKMIQETLAPYMPEATQIIQGLMQLKQQQAQQNMPPEQVQLQIEQAKLQQVQSDTQSDQQKNQIAAQESQAKIQLEQQKMASQNQLDQMKLQLEKLKSDSEVEISKLQFATEKEESEAGIQVEQMRVANDRRSALEALEMEILKHKHEMELEALKHGHEQGLKAAQHKAELESKESLERDKIKNINNDSPAQED